MANVTRRGLREMDLSDVVFQRVLRNKFLLAQGTLRDLKKANYKFENVTFGWEYINLTLL